MARKQASLNNDEKYVKLVIYKKRKWFTLFVCLAMTIGFTMWIWANLAQKRGDHWFVIALPLIFLGLLTNFLQPVEEWSYGPWQDSSQMCEKNIYD